MSRRLLLLATGCVVVLSWSEVTAEDPLLSAMRDWAARTAVTVVEGDQQHAATLIEQPVFRYSDQPRRFEDATLWVWTHESRPVAVQKVEAVADLRTGEPQWQFCLASLSAEHRIHAQWPGGQVFRSRETGLEYKAVPQSPPPAATVRERRLQIRRLSRRFAATLIDKPPGGDVRQELRLLPQPLYTYSHAESDLPAGAVIGFAANGTNPDALLVLDVHPGEAGEPRWHFAAARMTTGGLRLRFDGEEVWSVEWVRPRPGHNYDRWMFFKTPREAASDAEAGESETGAAIFPAAQRPVSGSG